MKSFGAHASAGTICAAALLLGGCATAFYEETKTGSFAGRLDVEWVAPNHFIYRPHSSDPLVFTASDGLRIQPKTMYTDGGSIPRLFWSAPLLGPWDFAPGYIIHDWLFRQHHCKDEGWEAINFPRSARVLAEAIKTQMVKGTDPDPTIVWAIYEAVRTSVAQRLWDSGQCTSPPPSIPAPAAPMSPGSTQVIKIMTIAF